MKSLRGAHFLHLACQGGGAHPCPPSVTPLHSAYVQINSNNLLFFYFHIVFLRKISIKKSIGRLTEQDDVITPPLREAPRLGL